MKALILLSGGLDSRLAIKLMLKQGIKVEALYFKLPFENSNLNVSGLGKISLHILDLTKGKLFQEYIKLVRKPKHGRGNAINPCIDCKIFMLKKAKELAKKVKADFIVTGEVLNERPMSQRKKIFKLMEREAGLEGKILRPLSAKLLPETEPEEKKWVNRKRLLGIQGRSRKPQLDLAKKFKLRNFPMPAGGCILCEKQFAAKLRDLFKHKKIIKPKDIEFLKLGRHFRYKNSKIIVGRNELENKQLTILKYKTDYIFEVPTCGSPVTILQGKKIKKSIGLAAKLTARYSDAEGKILVKYGMKKPAKNMIVTATNQQEINKLRI